MQIALDNPVTPALVKAHKLHLFDLLRHHQPLTPEAHQMFAGVFRDIAPKPPANDVSPEEAARLQAEREEAEMRYMKARQRELLQDCQLPLSVKQVILPILEKHDITWVDAIKKDRRRKLVAIRNEIFHAIFATGKLSIARIGHICGYDHTSILHALGRRSRNHA